MKKIKPFVKWVGGKTQLLPEILKHIPESFNTYYEPFIGGGALLFALQPTRAVISDVNTELINAYNVVKYSPNQLIFELSFYQNTLEFYNAIKNLDRDKTFFSGMSNIKKAARFIFLNKTCFNGLYRVNKKGQFNTSWGKLHQNDFVNSTGILNCSYYLNNNDIEIRKQDFEYTIFDTDINDFVYFDPPYDPISKTSDFTNYSKEGFTKHDQIGLRDSCNMLHKKGSKFLLSNSDTQFIRDLYKDYNIVEVLAKRSINCDKTGRGKIKELLIKNY